jgi:hypothetical protein
MARRQPVLADVAVHNLMEGGTGRLKANLTAAQALTTVWRLAYAAHKLGDWPTQAEYAEHWEINDRTAQRHWATFRAAFPEEEDPQRLAEWVLSHASARIEEPSCALTVAAPPPALAAV